MVQLQSSNFFIHVCFIRAISVTQKNDKESNKVEDKTDHRRTNGYFCK